MSWILMIGLLALGLFGSRFILMWKWSDGKTNSGESKKTA